VSEHPHQTGNIKETIAESEGESVPQEAERLLADMRDEYGIKGFPVAVYADGRRDDTCPWCHRTPEQGHDEDNCDWVAIDKALRLAEALLAECVSLRAERERQDLETGRIATYLSSAGIGGGNIADGVRQLAAQHQTMQQSVLVHLNDKAELKRRAEQAEAERDRLQQAMAELWGTFCPDCGPQDYATIIQHVTAERDRLKAERDDKAAFIRTVGAKLVTAGYPGDSILDDLQALITAHQSLVERVRGLVKGWRQLAIALTSDYHVMRDDKLKASVLNDCAQAVSAELDALLSSVSEQKEEQ
jgi:hypothetical protein